MINEQAANAFKTAKILTALYSRLDLARDAINLALESLPPEFDDKTAQQITYVTKLLSHEMRGIWDLRESEERRICEQIAHHAPPDDVSQIAAMSEVTFAPDQNQFPPLADPDSLPDPPVLAGPDDNTPNFIQINLPNFF
jgi:hypothetical protein